MLTAQEIAQFDELSESEQASAIRGIKAGIDNVIENWCNV